MTILQAGGLTINCDTAGIPTELAQKLVNVAVAHAKAEQAIDSLGVGMQLALPLGLEKLSVPQQRLFLEARAAAFKQLGSGLEIAVLAQALGPRPSTVQPVKTDVRQDLFDTMKLAHWYGQDHLAGFSHYAIKMERSGENLVASGHNAPMVFSMGLGGSSSGEVFSSKGYDIPDKLAPIDSWHETTIGWMDSEGSFHELGELRCGKGTGLVTGPEGPDSKDMPSIDAMAWDLKKMTVEFLQQNQQYLLTDTESQQTGGLPSGYIPPGNVTKDSFEPEIKRLLDAKGLKNVTFGEYRRTRGDRDSPPVYRQNTYPTPGGDFIVFVDGKATDVHVNLCQWNIGFREPGDAQMAFNIVLEAIKQL